jgi:hypothetical protein
MCQFVGKQLPIIQPFTWTKHDVRPDSIGSRGHGGRGHGGALADVDPDRREVVT